MASKEELKQILRELSSGGDVARIKEKAAESLKKVDPKTLSLAEQELMQEGISQEEPRRLCAVGGYIADNLRDHIYKEDNILYPTALSTLEKDEWDDVVTEFEAIGFCWFTPHISSGVDNLIAGYGKNA